jgi:endonuclease/exonuclease/phosphatase family metal-dependent hydrolase
MFNISGLRKRLESICLAGMVTLTGCTYGKFGVVRLNNAPSYNGVNKNEDIKKVKLAYWNSADLRGNTGNLFAFISEETSIHRAKSAGQYFKKEGVDIIGLGEVDYEDTWKTGFRDQPFDITKTMNSPHDYVVVDQYMKALLVPWTTGNAMISRHPTKVVHRHFYGENGVLDMRLNHLFKDFIHVKVKIGNKELDVIVSHLDNEDSSATRKKELWEINTYVRGYLQKKPDAYIALMLDANAEKDSTEIKGFLSHGIFHPPKQNYGIPTYPSDNPTRGISHIFVKNGEIEDYERFCLTDKNEEYISDHCGVKGTLVFD